MAESAPDTARETDAERIWRILERASVCMLITHDGERLHARPMAPHTRKDEHAIYFLTDARSAKEHEVRENADVCLVVMESAEYASVCGRAQCLADRALIEKLWTPFERAFWPGPDDPNIRVIKVTAAEAERWENSGKLVAFVEMASRVVTGDRPPDETHKAVL